MTNKTGRLALAIGLGLLSNICLAQHTGNAKYVDPFIGTAVQGHTYPGATSPFGLVQVSPETGNIGWNYCSGYHYEDKTLMGFSHTHLSGTGWMDLGDVLILPYTGGVHGYPERSHFSHQTEKAEPGYYTVQLDDYGVKAELTATQRAAFHHYTFTGNSGNLLIDLKHGIVPDSASLETHVVKSGITIEDKYTLTGYVFTKGWAGDKQVYFVMRFKQPIAGKQWLRDSNTIRNHQLVLQFANQQSLQLDMKIGLSTVSIAGARNNLDTEIPGWNFEAVRNKVYQTWDNKLGTVQITGTEKEKRIFYTGLYHNLVVPNNLADVDGKYRGANNEVFTAPNKAYYSTLSLWDTFRATNSLYALLYPDVTNGIVQSMIAHYEVKGVLPIWTLWGHENNGMIGNHAIPVIAEAWEKGIRNYDVNKAWAAIKTSSMVNHTKSDWNIYNHYGYYPCDIVKNESVSRTLECSYDDGCVAQLARSLGKKADYDTFSKRALYYKNVFDKNTSFMRGRKANGEWDAPFDPLRFSHASTGGNYTEGNAWPYCWHVMQDVDGLINGYGSKQTFLNKLDSMFSFQSAAFAHGARGRIGQYVHGNEPSHHVAYLYNLAGEPAKTQERVAEIKTTLYNDTPDGLCGNDDCGQMSAWYLFSAMGFYPVNPVDGRYVLGTPSFSTMTLRIGKKEFVITAANLSAENKYVQRIKLNGKLYDKPYITHTDLVKGGHLEFEMGDKPVNWQKQLNATFDWFRQHPPDSSHQRFLERWQQTTTLDRYGFQLSDTTWKQYRSCWVNDTAKAAAMENTDPILYYLHKAISTSVDEIHATTVKQGAVIWKLYNMGYIVKTKDACFGIDINQPGSAKLAVILDFVISSHVHGDHSNAELLDAMTAAGKPVYSPFYSKGVLINDTREFSHGEVALRFTMNVQGDVPVIVSRIDCGPSAHNYTIYHVGDARSVAGFNPDKHINLFILHIENAMDVFDAVARVKPDITVYDHVMELGHAVNKWRWSYQYTFDKIKTLSPASGYVLTWGEKLVVGN